MPPPQELEPREGYIAVGRVLRPWGLRGDVKIELLSDFPDERFAPGAAVWLAGERRTVEHAREQKGELYIKLSGIDDPEQAEAHRGRLLEVPEDALPPLEEDTYYHHQLVGLGVRTEAGDDLGAVTEVLTTGGSPALVVQGPSGEIVLPFIEDVVRSVDLTAAVITVELMEGLGPEPKKEPRRAQPRWYRARAARKR